MTEARMAAIMHYFNDLNLQNIMQYDLTSDAIQWLGSLKSI